MADVSRGGDGARAAEGFGGGGGERVRRGRVGDGAERVEVEESVVRAFDAAEVREETPVRATADATHVGVVVDLRRNAREGCERLRRVCRPGRRYRLLRSSRARCRPGRCYAVAAVGGEGRTWKRTVVASWARRGRRTSATPEGGMFATRNVTVASTRATSARGSARRLCSQANAMSGVVQPSRPGEEGDVAHAKEGIAVIQNLIVHDYVQSRQTIRRMWIVMRGVARAVTPSSLFRETSCRALHRIVLVLVRRPR